MRRARVRFSLLSAVLLSVLMSASTACVAAHVRAYVRIAPPPPIVEVRPAAPGPLFVWVAGYHRWDGRVYVWEPGRWVARPRPRAVWVPAHWVPDRRGWYFVEGHWRG